MKENVIIIIPAYNPDYLLEELIQNLNENGYTKILVIDDGSENKEIFYKLSKKTVILTHSKNLGKGSALKTGFKYCFENFKDILGVITVDDDGQHLISDINKIYSKLSEYRNGLILGSRNFNQKNVPFRSFLGNKIINLCFKWKTGFSIKDTQTGLRGIPYKQLNNFCNVEGARYEYETNMLLYAVENNIKIIEEPIECVYLNNNKSSHFRVIKDSIKIVSKILKNK